MPKHTLKHIMLTPEDNDFNQNNNDINPVIQLTSTPDLDKFKNSKSEQFVNIKKQKTKKNDANNNFGSMCNSNNLILSNLVKINTVRMKSGAKTRVLVQKETQVKFKNTITHFDSKSQESLVDIKQNIFGSMRSYGKFVNNLLTSNQSLANPNYQDNLLGMKSRSYCLLNVDDEESTNNNFSKKSSETKPQQNTLKTENDNLIEKKETDKSYVPHKQSQADFNKNLQKKVCFRDNEEVVKEETSSVNNIVPANPIKNIFLNYKPTQTNENTNFIRILTTNSKKILTKRNSDQVADKHSNIANRMQHIKIIPIKKALK